MCNKVPHKHAAVIKAWADGAQVQLKESYGQWLDLSHPTWSEAVEYRIKPEPKPDIVRYIRATKEHTSYTPTAKQTYVDNIKITFDGETGLPKSVDIIK